MLFFFWDTVTSLREVLPDQEAVSLIECDCTQVYFLLYIFYTGTCGDFVSCGNKPVNLSWDVRTITTLPRLFFLFSDLPLVFQL